MTTTLDIDAEVVRLLRTHGVKVITKMLHIGHARVKRIRRAAGLQPHASKAATPADMQERVVELLAADMIVSEIARRLGISGATVRKIRDRVEIEDEADPSPEEIAEIERRKQEVRDARFKQSIGNGSTTCVL